MLIILILVILFASIGVAFHFMKKEHEKTTSKVVDTPKPEVVEEEVVPAPVKKKRVYKKRVKKVKED